MSHPLHRRPLAGNMAGHLRAATTSPPQGASAPATTALPCPSDAAPAALLQEALACTYAVFPTLTGNFLTGNFNGVV